MSKPQIDLEQILSDKTRIETAVRRAVWEAIARHKRAGNPIAVWRDGRVVLIPADEIVPFTPGADRR